MARPTLKVVKYPKSSIVPLEMVHQYLAAKRTRDEAQEQMELLADSMKELMGTLSEVKVEGYKIVHSERSRTGLDTKRIKEELSWVFDTYSKTTEYTVFEIKAY